MSEWKNFELKELTIKIGSGATPRGGQEAYKSEGISLIRSQNILDFSFSYSGLAFIDGEQAHDLRNVIVEKDDVLINITGDSVARVAKVPDNVLPARVNQHVAILRADKDKLDSDYLLYYLLNPVFKRHLLRIASDGATRNALTKADLEELIIVAPEDVNIQKEIARLLSIYDQKITLLRQQNQDLEDLAQTLFKRWFVEEQDPTWVFVVLSDVADVFIGRTPPRKEEEWFSRNKEDVKWVSIKDLGENGVYISQTSEFLTHKAMDKFKVPLIEPNTVLLSFKMTLGRVGITTEKMLSNEAIAQFRIKEASNLSSEFLYFFLKLFKYQNLGSTSSIVTSINSGMIKDIPMVLPDKKILTKFSNSVSPLFQKIKVNSVEIQTLTQLRDTLLPKLMSGEICLEHD